MSFMHRVWASLYKQTAAEASLEPAIASLGVRYRTQFPLFLWHARALPYFPDFVLLDYRVIIEVDDDSHLEPKKIEEDRERTRKLREAGWIVVRCHNEDALKHPVATVNRLMTQLGLPLRATPPEPETTSWAHDARRRWGGAVETTDRYGPGSGSSRKSIPSPKRHSRGSPPSSPRR